MAAVDWSSLGDKSIAQLNEIFRTTATDVALLLALLKELDKRIARIPRRDRQARHTRRTLQLLRQAVGAKRSRLRRSEQPNPVPARPEKPRVIRRTAIPKAPSRPPHLVEYDQLMARFENLICRVALPTPTEAARVDQAHAMRALETLASEFENWMQRYPPQAFPWPKTLVVGGSGSFDTSLAEMSPLSILGYHVGKTSSLDERGRRAILDYAFANVLPPVESVQYMIEWGVGRSPQRLRRMAEHIASTAKRAKFARNSMAVAIKDWESDLTYLRHTYYTGHFGFGWPST